MTVRAAVSLCAHCVSLCVTVSLSQGLHARRQQGPCPTLYTGAGSPRPSVQLGPGQEHPRPPGPTPSSTPWNCSRAPVCARQAGA